MWIPVNMDKVPVEVLRAPEDREVEVGGAKWRRMPAGAFVNLGGWQPTAAPAGLGEVGAEPVEHGGVWYATHASLGLLKHQGLGDEASALAAAQAAAVALSNTYGGGYVPYQDIAAVRTVQSAYNALIASSSDFAGSPKLGVDGVYGPDTQGAVSGLLIGYNAVNNTNYATPLASAKPASTVTPSSNTTPANTTPSSTTTTTTSANASMLDFGSWKTWLVIGAIGTVGYLAYHAHEHGGIGSMYSPHAGHNKKKKSKAAKKKGKR